MKIYNHTSKIWHISRFHILRRNDLLTGFDSLAVRMVIYPEPRPPVNNGCLRLLISMVSAITSFRCGGVMARRPIFRGCAIRRSGLRRGSSEGNARGLRVRGTSSAPGWGHLLALAFSLSAAPAAKEAAKFLESHFLIWVSAWIGLIYVSISGGKNRKRFGWGGFLEMGSASKICLAVFVCRWWSVEWTCRRIRVHLPSRRERNEVA